MFRVVRYLHRNGVVYGSHVLSVHNDKDSALWAWSGSPDKHFYYDKVEEVR